MKLKDNAFEKVIREALKKTYGKLKADDLMSIKGILISNKDTNNIQIPWNSDEAAFNMTFPKVMFNVNNSENGMWIEDLTLFTNIKSLHIYIKIDDLSFLESFVNLEELYVLDSSETNWSFIENMLYLKYLWVHNCGFSNITPLGNLSEKQLEFFEKNKVINKKEFILFQGLENVHLNNCGISDISPLSKCAFLSDVDLSNNKISDLKPLSNLHLIYYLTIRYNNIKDITPLKNLKGLYYLNLRHNCIEDISILKGFENSNLSRLFLKFNKITDFSSIYNLYLVSNDIFNRCGDSVALITNLEERIPEQFLGDLKFNDKASKISNTKLRENILKYDKAALYYGLGEWNEFRWIYILLGNSSNNEEEFKDFIRPSCVEKILLENNNTVIRIVTKNSEYVFTGDSKKILEYYNRNFDMIF